MIRLPRPFFAPDAGGGAEGLALDAGADGGETWHSEYGYFQDNPDAVKSFADFRSPDDVFKSYSELRKQQSQPYRLPKELAKLSDEQRAEFVKSVAKLHGVPDGPDGYAFKLPEEDDLPIDEQAMTEFKALLHAEGVPPATAQKFLDLQRGMVKRLNTDWERSVRGRADNNYKQFKDVDCQGDAKLAAEGMEQVKRYLQTFCKNADGEIDTEMWKGFEQRMMRDDRFTELILLRALVEPARLAVGTGGAPGSFGRQLETSGALSYPEMGKR